MEPREWRPPRMPNRIAVDPLWDQPTIDVEADDGVVEDTPIRCSVSRRTSIKRVTITFEIPQNTSLSLAVRGNMVESIKRVLAENGLEGESYRIMTEARPW